MAVSANRKRKPEREIKSSLGYTAFGRTVARAFSRGSKKNIIEAAKGLSPEEKSKMRRILAERIAERIISVREKGFDREEQNRTMYEFQVLERCDDRIFEFLNVCAWNAGTKDSSAIFEGFEGFVVTTSKSGFGTVGGRFPEDDYIEMREKSYELTKKLINVLPAIESAIKYFATYLFMLSRLQSAEIGSDFLEKFGDLPLKSKASILTWRKILRAKASSKLVGTINNGSDVSLIRQAAAGLCFAHLVTTGSSANKPTVRELKERFAWLSDKKVQQISDEMGTVFQKINKKI